MYICIINLYKDENRIIYEYQSTGDKTYLVTKALTIHDIRDIKNNKFKYMYTLTDAERILKRYHRYGLGKDYPRDKPRAYLTKTSRWVKFNKQQLKSIKKRGSGKTTG